jgi:hypothetical protein
MLLVPFLADGEVKPKYLAVGVTTMGWAVLYV